MTDKITYDDVRRTAKRAGLITRREQVAGRLRLQQAATEITGG